MVYIFRNSASEPKKSKNHPPDYLQHCYRLTTRFWKHLRTILEAAIKIFKVFQNYFGWILEQSLLNTSLVHLRLLWKHSRIFSGSIFHAGSTSKLLLKNTRTSEFQNKIKYNSESSQDYTGMIPELLWKNPRTFRNKSQYSGSTQWKSWKHFNAASPRTLLEASRDYSGCIPGYSGSIPCLENYLFLSLDRANHRSSHYVVNVCTSPFPGHSWNTKCAA